MDSERGRRWTGGFEWERGTGVETGGGEARVVVGPLEGGESHITAEQH